MICYFLDDFKSNYLCALGGLLPVHTALLVAQQISVRYLTMLWLTYQSRLFVQTLTYPRDGVVAFVVRLNVLL